MKKILVVIPARGGSKGIPRKNLRLLNNKPLIYYSIQTALNSKYNLDVYVSS
jgi:CMP-N-acetylneuraminic acid synthetase